MITDRDALFEHLKHEATWSMAQDGAQTMWFTEDGLREALQSQPPAKPEPRGDAYDNAKAMAQAIGERYVERDDINWDTLAVTRLIESHDAAILASRDNE